MNDFEGLDSFDGRSRKCEKPSTFHDSDGVDVPDGFDGLFGK